MEIVHRKDPDSIRKILTLLRDGRPCVLPCDTIYGLCAIYGKGYESLKELKGRDASKPFIVLATKAQAQHLCKDIPDEIFDRWPCALTAVLNAACGGTIGIRVPDDGFLTEILEALQSPVYSTSVNISGSPSLVSFSEITEKFGNRVELFVKDKEVQGTLASTLIDATSRPFRLLRQGVYDISDIIGRSSTSFQKTDVIL